MAIYIPDRELNSVEMAAHLEYLHRVVAVLLDAMGRSAPHDLVNALAADRKEYGKELGVKA